MSRHALIRSILAAHGSMIEDCRQPSESFFGADARRPSVPPIRCMISGLAPGRAVRRDVGPTYGQ